MTACWAVGGLLALVAALHVLQHAPRSAWCFRWLPLPFWCYVLPAVLVSAGWLPAGEPSYAWVTRWLLPFALGLLLLGVDLPAVARTGRHALGAAAVGALGVCAGSVLWTWAGHAHLGAEAWKGAGALAGTWTGGSLNLLALQQVLDIPDDVFAPLILVDAVIAYGWMALLVTLSGYQTPINRWLGAEVRDLQVGEGASRPPRRPAQALGSAAAVGLSALLMLLSAAIAARLPPTALVGSRSAWMILVLTTLALAGSLHPALRRIAADGERLGLILLSVVLAGLGAQASLAAFRDAAGWLAVGAGVALVHGVLLLAVGRWRHIPLGVLATASQANFGGVVSGPLVGAVYHRALAPVGLLLAVAGNAVGTYLGWVTAHAVRWLAR